MKTKRKNPYIAGSPIRGREMFFGRDDVFEWLHNNLVGEYQDNPIVLYGERRTGKTSILYQIPRHMDMTIYLPILVDLQGFSLDSINSFLWQIAVKIWSELSQIEDMKDFPLPSHENFVKVPQLYFSEEFLPAVQRVVGQRRLLIMFDEFDLIRMKVQEESLPDDIFDYLRALMGNSHHSFIFSLGNRLEDIETQYSVLFNQALYHKIKVSFLKEADARSLMTEPVAEYYAYDEDAINLILKATSGHPFYIQNICHAIFVRRKIDEIQPVTIEAVEQALTDVVNATAQNLKFAWDDVTPEEQVVLAATATLSRHTSDAVSQAEIVNLLHQQELYLPSDELNNALEKLLTRDMLRQVGNEYSFAVEILRLWILKERRLGYVRRKLDEARLVEQWRQQAMSTQTKPPILPPTAPDAGSISPKLKLRRPWLYWWSGVGAVAVVVMFFLLSIGLPSLRNGRDALSQPTQSDNLNSQDAVTLIAPPLLPTNTSTPQVDPPTLAATPIPQAVSKKQLAVRIGPGDDYEQLGFIPPETFYEIIGRDSTEQWWKIKVSLGEGWGWIDANDDSVDVINTDGVPIALAPTPTPSSTSTETSTPTTTPTPNPTITPTFTPSIPTTTSTPTPIRGEFVLLSPIDFDDSYGETEFIWQWDGPLAKDQGFEIRIWRDGEIPTGVHNAKLDNQQGKIKLLDDNTYQLQADITSYIREDGIKVNRLPGEYYWTVLLIQVEPEYRTLGIQAPPGRLTFNPKNDSKGGGTQGTNLTGGK